MSLDRVRFGSIDSTLGGGLESILHGGCSEGYSQYAVVFVDCMQGLVIHVAQ